MKLSHRGFDAIPIKKLNEIFECCHPEKKILFIIDDPFGVSSFEETAFEEWSKYHDDISYVLKKNSPNMKILFTSRTLILQNTACKKFFPLMSENVINISHGAFSLNNAESLKFIRSCVDDSTFKCMLDSKSISDSFSQHQESFFLNPSLPLVCKLCKNSPQKWPSQFPVKESFHSILLLDLNRLVSCRGDLFIALLVVMICKNSFQISKLSTLQVLVRNIVSNFKIAPHFQTKFLQNPTDVMEEMVGSYLVCDDGIYCFSNEYIFNMVTYFAGLLSPETTIKHSSSAFLREHVHFIGCNCEGKDHTIYLEIEVYEIWFQRIIADLQEGHFRDVFFSATFLCKVSLFIEKLGSMSSKFVLNLFTESRSNIAFEDATGSSWANVSSTAQNIQKRLQIGAQLISTIPTQTAFHWLLVLGNLQLFDVVWKTLLLYEKTESLVTLSCLKLAIIGGDIKILKELLSHHCNTYACEEKTLLTNAKQVWRNLTHSQRRITQHSNFLSCSPLCLAATCNNTNLTDYLISISCDVNEVNKEFETPISQAAKYGHTEMISLLLQHKSNVDLKDLRGYTPLMHAVSNISCFELLLSAGADPYTTTQDGETVLMMACEKGEVQMVRSILDSLRCNVDPVLGDDRSRKLRYLKQYINKTNKNGTTALLKTSHLQAHKAACDIIDLLISDGADINVCDTIQQSSAMHIAAMNNNVDLLSKLYKQGANIHAQDRDGVTPLFIAAEYGFIDAVNILCFGLYENPDFSDVGILEMKRTTDNMTPLFIAAERGHSFVVTKLCCFLAKTNVTNIEGSSALLLASINNHTKVCKTLLDLGADVNVRNILGYNPILVASRNGNTKLVQLYIEKGANVNCTSGADGYTPLMLASMMGNVNCVKYLLLNGADESAKDNKGFSATAYASFMNHKEIVDILLLFDSYGICHHIFQTPSVYNPRTPPYAATLSSLSIASKLSTNQSEDLNLCNLSLNCNALDLAPAQHRQQKRHRRSSLGSNTSVNLDRFVLPRRDSMCSSSSSSVVFSDCGSRTSLQSLTQ